MSALKELKLFQKFVGSNRICADYDSNIKLGTTESRGLRNQKVSEYNIEHALRALSKDELDKFLEIGD